MAVPAPRMVKGSGIGVPSVTAYTKSCSTRLFTSCILLLLRVPIFWTTKKLFAKAKLGLLGPEELFGKPKLPPT